MTHFVKTRRDGSVLEITLDRAEKKNALTGAMYDQLSVALKVANDESGVGAVLIQGSGGVFTAGNDIGDFLAYAMNPARPSGDSPAIRFIKALVANQKPLVACVDGVAVGIGTTLLLHCDFVVASPRAVFHTPFVDLGLVPEAGSSLLLPRRIGPAKAAEMLMLGRRIDADEALAIGLINELIDTDHVIPHTLELTHKLAAKPRLAMQAARRLAHGDKSELLARVEEESRLFGEALQSEEARLAFTAFMSRPKN